MAIIIGIVIIVGLSCKFGIGRTTCLVSGVPVGGFLGALMAFTLAMSNYTSLFIIIPAGASIGGLIGFLVMFWFTQPKKPVLKKRILIEKPKNDWKPNLIET